MNTLRPVERAYIAGFFDGDGCVHFRKSKNGRHHRRPIITFGQKDPAILHHIQALLGCGYVRGTGEYWQLGLGSKKDVLDFIDLILKYSVVKRKKLLEARRHWDLPPDEAI